MSPGGKQQIAWFFILLLAGHEVVEAARIHKTRRSHAAGFQSTAPLPSDQEAEAAWQAENAKCGSHHLFWCADGPKNPHDEAVRRCAKQPMSGDVRTTNEVCRVTDDWMLKGTPEKPSSWWLGVQIKLLKAKTAKLVESCGKGNPKNSARKCTRRMQHVLRAIKFIAKASKGDAFGQLTPEQVNEAQDAANDARVKVSQVIFDKPGKQEQVNRLVEALKKDQKGLQQNPKATITKSLKVLEEDILPDDADPAVADEKIQKMELEARPADPEDEATINARVKELEEDVANSPSDLDHTFDDTIEEAENGMIEEEEALANGTNSSLMQLRDGETAVKVIGFVVLVVLVVLAIKFAIAVVWGLIVFWIVASIFGCSVAAIAGHDRRRKKVGGSMKQWGGCVVKWVSMPFVLMFRGIKWLFTDKKKNPKSSLAQINRGSGSGVRVLETVSSK